MIGFLRTLLPSGVLMIAMSIPAPAAFARDADPCATASSTMELNECAQRQFEVKDRELNSVYQAVLKQLASYQDNGPDTKKQLIAAQRKWVEFRDADCKAMQRLYQGGTVAAQIYLDCMTQHTEQRIKELQPVNWQAG